MINTILSRLAALTYQKALIVAIAVAALFYFTLYDDGSAVDKKIADLQNQVNAEQLKTKESDAALKEVDLIRSSIGALSEQFKIAAQQLPSEIQMADILKSIDTLAKSAGVNIRSKEPRSSKKEDILELIPLHVNLQGSFSEITMFLYYVSSMERISRVVNFNISVTGAEALKYKNNGLVFDGEIVSYRYLGDAKRDEVKK